jgi:hypothetical protein
VKPLSDHSSEHGLVDQLARFEAIENRGDIAGLKQSILSHLYQGADHG